MSSKQNGKANVKDLNSDQTVEVLYQKMGDRWFAFSLVGEDVFVGSIAQDEIDQAALDGIPANEPKNSPIL